LDSIFLGALDCTIQRSLWEARRTISRRYRADINNESAMARTFDQISREDGGQLWPATAFVEWLRRRVAGVVSRAA
jgi:hypothetical protein